MNGDRLLYLNPERFDYLHAVLIQGLSRNPRIQLSAATAGNYGTRSAECFDGDWERIRRALGEFDTLVVGTSGMNGALEEPARRLLHHSARQRPSQTRVIVDSGDLGAVSLTRGDLRITDALFKRELYRCENSVGNFLKLSLGRRTRDPVENSLRAHAAVRFPYFVENCQVRPVVSPRWLLRPSTLPRHLACFPLPIGIEDRVVQTLNPRPDVGVSSYLQPNIVGRRILIGHLAQRHAESVRVGTAVNPRPRQDPDLVALGALSHNRPDAFHHYSSYYDALRRSRASISFPGAGFDTARFWEILASGALLISKAIPLEMPNPLIPGEHFLAFETLEELDAAIHFVRTKPWKADAIRQRGHEFALRVHSADARAAYFVGCLAR